MSLERRAFLGGPAIAGVASVLAPRAALAQGPASIGASGVPLVPRTAEHLIGSAVNYAYAVKAGPFVFLNGHEGYDFEAGVVPAVAGAPAFPRYGRPGLRREADFIFDRMGRILKSFGTDFAHSVRLDQYYMEANAVRAYHLARFAAFGKYVPPSTSILTEGCFGAKSNITTSLVAVVPDPQWEIKGVYPESARVSPFSGYAPSVVVNDFVFAAGAEPIKRTCSIPIPRWGRIAAGRPNCRSGDRRSPRSNASRGRSRRRGRASPIASRRRCT